MEPAIFFSGPPNLDELCSITVNVRATDGLCLMQPQVVRCREVIFTEPDVIASPCFDLDACFTVVLQQSLFKTGRLQTRLQKQGMQMSKPNRVQPSLYKSCLTYTIITRLSPLWNKTGEWMIQGRDFISHDGYTNAIKMSVNVNREEIYVSLAGAVVKFPPLQVEDLNLSRSEMKAILQSTQGEPYPVDLADAWCHVLPSLKRAKIASITLLIPKESPFSSYKELKRHWKNMYGYRLPETDEDVLYCQVGFQASGGGRHFTYPSTCLRSCPPQIVPRVDPKPVLTVFLQEMHTRVGSVCGMPLRFQPRLRYAAPALHNSAQPPAKVNLSSKPQNKPSGPMRDNKSVAALYNSSNANNKKSLRERLSTPDTETIWATSAEMGEAFGTGSTPIPVVGDHHDCPENPNKGTFSQASQQTGSSVLQSAGHNMWEKTNRQHPGREEARPMQRQIPSGQNKSQGQNHQSPASLSSSKKLVPLFRPKMKAANSQPTTASSFSGKSSDTSSGRIVPVFKSQNSKNVSALKHADSACKTAPSSQNNSNNTNSSSTFSKYNASQSAAAPRPTKLFTLDDDDDNQHYTIDEPSSMAAKLPPPSMPLFSQKPKVLQFGFKTPKSKPDTPKITSKPSASKPQTPRSNPTKVLKASTPTAAVNSSMKPPQQSPNKTPLQSPRKIAGTPNSAVGTPRTPFNFSGFDDDDDFDRLVSMPSTPKLHDGKRKNPTEVETTPKKPRAKPQVQNVDVEALARASQLGKVNATTLIAWLKDKGVACKAKDKKSDLLDKVNSFLNITSAEQ